MTIKLLGQWKVSLPDEAHVWSPDDMLGSECLLIETETGQTFDDWIADIDARKFQACQVLVWWLRRKAGTQVDRFAVDFPLRRLDLERIADDPKASPVSDSSISDPSPTTSESTPSSTTD